MMQTVQTCSSHSTYQTYFPSTADEREQLSILRQWAPLHPRLQAKLPPVQLADNTLPLRQFRPPQIPLPMLLPDPVHLFSRPDLPRPLKYIPTQRPLLLQTRRPDMSSSTAKIRSLARPCGKSGLQDLLQTQDPTSHSRLQASPCSLDRTYFHLHGTIQP